MVGSNRCVGEMLQSAARANVGVSVRRWSLEGLKELAEAYKEDEGDKLVLDLEKLGLGELGWR